MTPSGCGDAECRRYAERVEELAGEGEKTSNDTIAGLLEIQTDLVRVQNRVHEIIRVRSKASSILGAIKEITRQRVARAGGWKTFGALALVAGAGFGGHEMAARKAKPNPGPALTAAQLAMVDRGYAAAADGFRQAADAGGDPECCLGRLAECRFYLGDLPAAEAACDELEGRNPGSPSAAYVRGLVREAQGNVPEAVRQYRLAKLRNLPLADLQLRRLAAK